MSTPADSGYRWQDVLKQYERLSQFKAWLPGSVRGWLDRCEWTLTPGAGQSNLLLLTLRCPERVRLRDPHLIELAEYAQSYWGPLDLSIFSAESPEPVRVLSQTLVDIGRHS